MIPYKGASKFLDQRKGREGNEEREGGGGGGGGWLFVEEMERGEGGNVVKWGNGEGGFPVHGGNGEGGRGEGCEMGKWRGGRGGRGVFFVRIGNGEGGRGGIM